MKTKVVTYSKVFSLGNYENEKIGVEIEIQEGDDVQKALQSARQFVEFNHKLNGFQTELSRYEHIVSNPEDFTGRQLENARKRISEIHDAINSGTKLLAETQSQNEDDLPY